MELHIKEEVKSKVLLSTDTDVNGASTLGDIDESRTVTDTRDDFASSNSGYLCGFIKDEHGEVATSSAHVEMVTSSTHGEGATTSVSAYVPGSITGTSEMEHTGFGNGKVISIEPIKSDPSVEAELVPSRGLLADNLTISQTDCAEKPLVHDLGNELTVSNRTKSAGTHFCESSQYRQCPMCSRTVDFEKHLSNHNNGTILYPCSSCGICFEQKEMTMHHQRLAHPHNQKDAVSKVLEKKSSYSVKISKPTGPINKFDCKLCHRKFSRYPACMKHTNICDTLEYKCDICSANFKRQSHLINHKAVQHSSKFDDQSGEKIKASLQGSDYDLKVKSDVYGTSLGTRPDNTCAPGNFNNTGNVNSTETLISQSKISQEAKFSTVSIMTENVVSLAEDGSSNLEMETGTESEAIVDRLKHKCTLCNRGFRSLLKCNEHVENHKSMVHKCKICGSCYQTKSSLLSHLRFYHDSVTTCHVCKKRSRNYTVLLEHLYEKHQISYVCSANDCGAFLCKKHPRSKKLIPNRHSAEINEIFTRMAHIHNVYHQEAPNTSSSDRLPKACVPEHHRTPDTSIIADTNTMTMNPRPNSPMVPNMMQVLDSPTYPGYLHARRSDVISQCNASVSTKDLCSTDNVSNTSNTGIEILDDEDKFSRTTGQNVFSDECSGSSIKQVMSCVRNKHKNRNIVDTRVNNPGKQVMISSSRFIEDKAMCISDEETEETVNNAGTDLNHEEIVPNKQYIIKAGAETVTVINADPLDEENDNSEDVIQDDDKQNDDNIIQSGEDYIHVLTDDQSENPDTGKTDHLSKMPIANCKTSSKCPKLKSKSKSTKRLRKMHMKSQGSLSNKSKKTGMHDIKGCEQCSNVYSVYVPKHVCDAVNTHKLKPVIVLGKTPMEYLLLKSHT